MTRTTEPTVITQGERVAWTRSFDDYSPDNYSLQYRFRGQGYGFNVDATASDGKFNTEITAAVSQSAGVTTYQWQAWLINNSDPTNTFPVDSGEMIVKIGFGEGTAAMDLRSQAKKTLDAIDAALAGKATADQLEYEMSTPTGTLRLKRMMMKDLLDARAFYARLYANEVAQQQANKTGEFGQQFLVRINDNA